MKLRPLIIGHRGASAVAPENTMAAFRETLAVGADGIEFDVRLTRDGVPVVIHDSTLRRTGRLPDRVADLTWAEIKKVDVGSWFAPSFANETVPNLAELFTLFQSNNSTLYLEMKSESPSEQRALVQACVRAIDEHAFQERVIVECFQLPALKIVSEIEPEIKTVALFEPSFTNPGVLSDQRIISQAKDVGASALALHHRLARESLVRKAKDAGLHVAVWTVDDPAWIERARTMGIDALITNNPAVMLAHR
ncbi:MAG TPA: glycerophosphodiester phosphodiesterase family protein [Pyrinomonadaceae bacterium]|nr:glycerophosphodiester phosphodiesterase family protein [Pyrinomonadaceae bacterium]